MIKEFDFANLIIYLQKETMEDYKVRHEKRERKEI